MSRRFTAIVLPLLLLPFPLPILAAPLLQAAEAVRISQVDTSDYPRVTLYINVVDAGGRVAAGLA